MGVSRYDDYDNISPPHTQDKDREKVKRDVRACSPDLEGEYRKLHAYIRKAVCQSPFQCWAHTGQAGKGGWGRWRDPFSMSSEVSAMLYVPIHPFLLSGSSQECLNQTILCSNPGSAIHIPTYVTMSKSDTFL